LIVLFNDTPLTGDQLAVFTDTRGFPEEMLQPLDGEMNSAKRSVRWWGRRYGRPRPKLKALKTVSSVSYRSMAWRLLCLSDSWLAVR
jgi:hypothetical protein